MKRLKKGPELKLSELKVPDFAYDIYYDLKERHLLPLVAVLVVAMVAVPIYVKDTSGSESEPLPHTAPIASAPSSGGGEALAVTRSEPGLRSFQRRLKGAHPLDPFATKGGGASGEVSATTETGSGEEARASEASTSSAAEIPAEATVVGEEPSPAPSETAPPAAAPPAEESAPSGESSGGAPSDVGGVGGKARTRYASAAIDVRIVSVPAPSAQAKSKSKRKKPPTRVRRNLPELTMLPARATPAATFMGTSRDGKKALMLISSDVVSIFGEADCVIGSQSCQLLALETGMPETFVYGPHERTFRIELLKIRHTLSAKPRRAPLGTSKKKRDKQHHAGGSEPAGRG